MTGPEPEELARHGWLRRMALERQLPNAERIPEDPGGTPIEAWETVRNVTGLQMGVLVEHVAEHYGLPVADPMGDVDRDAAGLISERIARKIHVVPLGFEDGALVVATAVPGHKYLADAVIGTVGRPVIMKVMGPYEVDAWIVNVYQRGRTDLVGNIDLEAGDAEGFTVRAVDAAGREQEPEKLDPRISATAHLVSVLFSEGLALGASDIHMQPIGAGGFIRYRVDGLLGHGVFLPGPAFRKVISRIKALAGMDVSDNLRPQDGRIYLHAGLRQFDVRLSTVPVGDMQTMVMRILDSRQVRRIEEAGFRDPELSQLKRLLQVRQGVVLVTGPTGSGKTTTLHGALWELNQAEVDIHTIEDPVEYSLPGASQIQVSEARGVTFASALRAILRQDPDIILVGEVRDEETAAIMTQAAMTGHLVLSTLHTTDAVTTLPRLVELGITPASLSEVLAGVVAQRLVRRICSDCAKEASEAPSGEDEHYRTATGRIPPRVGAGCSTCNFSGYRGRIPITQVLVMDRALRDVVNTGAELPEIRAVAEKSGMRSLALSADDLVMEGITTVEEAVRVLGAGFWAGIGAEGPSTTTPEGL